MNKYGEKYQENKKAMQNGPGVDSGNRVKETKHVCGPVGERLIETQSWKGVVPVNMVLW